MKTFIKLCVLTIVITFMYTCAYSCLAETTLNVSLKSNNDNIAKDQKEITLYLNLQNYDSDGILGYEATLEYDKEVFEEVSMIGLNGWEKPEYNSTTNKFVSTTKEAKTNTNIAEIKLKLKDQVTKTATQVSIKELIVSDGMESKTFNLSKKFNILINQKDTEKNITDDNVINDNTINDNIPNQRENEVANDILTENNTIKNDVKGNNQTTNISVNEISKNQTDSTTATKKMPQTGGISTFILIAIISAVAIVCYIKYRSIQIK